MLDNLLKNEPYLGCHYLSVIRARSYLAWSLLLTEPFAIGKNRVVRSRLNTFVYIAYQLGGTKLVMGFFILLALFFSIWAILILKNLGNTQKLRINVYTSNCGYLLCSFFFSTSQLDP